MRRILFLLIILFISIGIGLQLHYDPGYVLITINQWTIETSVWFLVFAVLLSFYILHQILLFLKTITELPQNYHDWKVKHDAQIAQEKTRLGFIEFSEGYWAKAKNHLIKALPNTETPLLNYLTAARAAQEMGDPQLRDTYLREAQQSMPEAQIAVELTQAQLQLANKQWEQALATLRHLQEIAPKHPYVLKLLMALYIEIEDWPQLIILLPELKKHHLLSDTDLYHWYERAYLNVLSDRIKQNQQASIEQLIKELPKTLAQNPEIVAAYARYLIDTHQDVLAGSVLENALRKEFHPKLITRYGELSGNNHRLQFAESFLKKQAHSAELLLCLAKLSSANQLWGKTKTYLEESIALQATPEAYAEMGRLFEALHEPLEACDAYRESVSLFLKRN